MNKMLNLRKLTAGLAALTLLVGSAAIAMAATTANQTVSIVVPELVLVGVSGGTVTLNITEVDTEVSDSTSADITYVNNTTSSKKITAKADSIPTGITFKVEVADGTGQITLTTTDQDVTNSFTQTKATKDITYTASAAANAEATTHNITVTYTITDG